MWKERKLHLNCSDFAELVEPFWKAGVFDFAEVYGAECFGRWAGVKDGEILLALALALRAPRQGHVGVELKTVADRIVVENNLGLLWPEPNRWLKKVVECESLVDRHGTGRQPFVVVNERAHPCKEDEPARLLSRRYFRLEQEVAQRFRELMQAPLLMEESRALSLAERALRAVENKDELLKAVASSLSRRLAVITGGPGSGKTFAVKFVLYAHWLAAEGKPPVVALAAPTGKAAQRLKQALEEESQGYFSDSAFFSWMKSLETCTLHRLLEAQRGWPTRFQRNFGRPLESRLIVVDEVSMVDLEMMWRLLQALDGNISQTLLLLGDSHQLASVEAGCILRDLGQALGGSDFLFRLSGQHRLESSALRKLASLVVEGRVNEALEMLVDSREQELVFYPLEKGRLGDEALACIHENFVPYLEALQRGPTEALEAWQRFGLLTPYRQGELGVEGLNQTVCEMLRRLLPEKLKREGWFDHRMEWYPGRAVIVPENRYDLGLYNGDIGVVVIDQGQRMVHFSTGDFPSGLLGDCQTAFALTVHKAQGSQFEKVALVIGRDSPLLTRELIYTAITRARRQLFVMGDVDNLRGAIERSIDRASGLEQLLKNG